MRWPWIVTALIVANILLQVLDVWTTLIVLADGGTEGNPTSLWVMETFGIEVWVGIKVAFTLALAWVVRWTWTATERDNQKATLAAAFVAVWMGVVILNNLMVMGIL